MPPTTLRPQPSRSRIRSLVDIRPRPNLRPAEFRAGLALVLTLGCAFGCSRSQNDSLAAEQLEGNLGDTLTNKYFAVKLERIAEEMETSPYNADIGQRNRRFHALILNNSGETREFDRVVMITVGSDGFKHTNTHHGGLRNGTEPIPFQLGPGEAMRIDATVPERSVKQVAAFVVGFAKGEQSLGEPLTFRLENATFEQDPLLARLHGSSAAASAPPETAVPKKVEAKLRGAWNEELRNSAWSAQVEAISRRPGSLNLMRPELTGTELVFRIAVFNCGDRPLSFSRLTAKTIGGEREFAFAIGSEDAEDSVSIEPGQGLRSEITASESTVPVPERLEIELTSAKRPVGEKLTFDLKDARGTDAEGLTFVVGRRDDPQTRNLERTRQILKRFRRGEEPVEGRYVVNADSLGLLRETLSDDSATVRYGAAFLLGEMGKDAAPAVPDLVKAFDDPAYSVRLASLRAVGKIDSPESLSALLRLTSNVTDENYASAFIAASSVILVGSTEIVGGYDVLLDEFESDERKSKPFDLRKYVAAREIGRSGEPLAVDDLIENGTEADQAGAGVALCFRRIILPEWLDWLRDRSKNGSALVQAVARIALIRFGYDADAATTDRSTPIEEAYRQRRAAGEVWERIRAVYDDPGSKVDVRIWPEMLCEVARRLPEFRKTLVDLAVAAPSAGRTAPGKGNRGTDFTLSMIGVGYLCALKDPRSITLLTERLDTERDPLSRYLLILALAQGPDAASALPQMAQELGDPTSLASRAAVDAITSMKGAAKPVIPAVENLLRELRSRRPNPLDLGRGPSASALGVFDQQKQYDEYCDSLQKMLDALRQYDD